MFRFFSLPLEHLNRSFAATYALLERPKVARRTVVLLLAIHTGLLAYSAYVHSPTLNEPGHLVAGLSYWKFGRFDVYNVNPPLVKLVAALPVMVVGYGEDWSGFYSGLGARPEFAMGEDFVAANGERSFFLVMIARWACIPFSWLGGIVCYLWARDLYGRPSGLIACAIWCFEPNILAHASLITSDAAGTALGLAACYTFWRWLKHPTWSQAALTGVLLGLAELTKTTLILFYPLWPLMWAFYRWRGPRAVSMRGLLREAGMLAARMLIGLYILNLGYAFEGSFTKLSDYRFASKLFARDTTVKGPDVLNKLPAAGFVAPELNNNRFDGTWLGALPVPLPKNYLLGIDLQQKDFEHYGRPSYLRGQWRAHGCWYYYLYACAIKVPLGLWAIGGVALSMAALRGFSVQGSVSEPTAYGLQAPASSPDLIILLFPALVIFIVVSAKTGINEHMRYVLPSFPFVFIAISGILRSFVDNAQAAGVHFRSLGEGTLRRAACLLLVTLLLWSVASSWSIYPHSLSYFNELIGGPLEGPRHLLGSNVDWGQDLGYLKEWVEKRRASNRMARNTRLYVACFGYVSPTEFGIPNDGAVPPVDHYSRPSAQTPGSVVASKNSEVLQFDLLLASRVLVGGSDWAPPSLGNFSRHEFSRWMRWARRARPIAVIGYSHVVIALLENND